MKKLNWRKFQVDGNGNMIEGLSGDKFKFDKNGDGPARYNIIHFKQIEPGKYEWVRVGKYLSGELRLNMSGKPQIGRFAIPLPFVPFSREIERHRPPLSLPTRIFLAAIQFKLGHPEPPESVCSLPCEVGQAKKYVAGEQCCWHCFNCTQYQVCHLSLNLIIIQCLFSFFFFSNDRWGNFPSRVMHGYYFPTKNRIDYYYYISVRRCEFLLYIRDLIKKIPSRYYFPFSHNNLALVVILLAAIEPKNFTFREMAGRYL